METKKTDIYSKLFDFKQKELKLTKNTEGFNYKYATLLQIQEGLAPILKELRLIVIHSTKGNEVITQIRDIDSNTFIESVLEIGEVQSTRVETYTEKKKVDKDVVITEYNSKDPQGVGSIITYYRRYNLIALLDLEIEDDDGAKGGQRANNNYNRQQANIYTMTQDDVNKLWNGKIYGTTVYINKEKKTISNEQIIKLKLHEKYVESLEKK